MTHSDLVAKVAEAIEKAEAQNVQGFIYPDMAKAAIATVLAEMMGGPNEAVERSVIKAVRRMAAIHKIALPNTKPAASFSANDGLRGDGE